MKLAVRIPIFVEGQDADCIEGQSRIQNWLFNHLLEIANREKARFKETQDPEASRIVYTERGLRNLVPGLKLQYPFLKTCHSSPLKNTALRLSRSIRAFQDDQKRPKKERLGRGWPKFRSSKKKFFSLEYDEYCNGYQIEKEPQSGVWFLVLSLGKNKEGQKLQLRIRMKELPAWIEQSIHSAQEQLAEAKRKAKLDPANKSEKKPKLHLRQFLPFTGIRIKRVGKSWFAILSAEREEKTAVQKIQSMAVIDPNHKNLGYLVDDQGQAVEIQNLRFVKSLDRRIDEIQKRRDHCIRNSVKIEREDGSRFYKTSRRWKFFQDYLDELRRVRREQIKSALYCISNQLVERYDFISVGDYTPRGGGISKGMRRSMNNQSQIGLFKHTLKWVCQREGKLYSEWDERSSTKTCAQCITKHDPLDPSIRVWKCSVCETTHLRDENSALNGFKQEIQTLEKKQMPCSGHLFELWKFKTIPKVQSRWTWGFSGRGISISRASECVQSQPPRN